MFIVPTLLQRSIFYYYFCNQIYEIIFESKKKKKKRQTVLSVRGKELLARATLGHMADQGRSVSGRQ